MRSRSLLNDYKADAILLLREDRLRRQRLQRRDGDEDEDGSDQDTPHLNRLIRILAESSDEEKFHVGNNNENNNETIESSTRVETTATMPLSISTTSVFERNTSSNPELQFWSSPMASNQKHIFDSDAKFNPPKITPIVNNDTKSIETVSVVNDDGDSPFQNNRCSEFDQGRDKLSRVDVQKETAAVASLRTKVDNETTVSESPCLLSLLSSIRRMANRKRINIKPYWKAFGQHHLNYPKRSTNDSFFRLYPTILGRAMNRCQVRNALKVAGRRLEELSWINRCRTFSSCIRDSNDKNANETESSSLLNLIASPCRNTPRGSQRISFRGASNSFEHRKGNRNQRSLTTVEKCPSSQKLWETAFLTAVALFVYQQQNQQQKEQAITVDLDYNDSFGNSHWKRGTQEEESRSLEVLRTKKTIMTSAYVKETEQKDQFPALGRGCCYKHGHADEFECHRHEQENQHQFSRGDKQEILFLEKYDRQSKDCTGENGTKRTPSETKQGVLKSVQTAPKTSREEKRFISKKDAKSTNSSEISNGGGSINHRIGKNEKEERPSLLEQNKGKFVPPTPKRQKGEERSKSKDAIATNSSEMPNGGDELKNNLCNQSASKHHTLQTHYPKERQLQTCKSKEFLLLQRFGLLPRTENTTDSESSIISPTKHCNVHDNADQASQLRKDSSSIDTPTVSQHLGRVEVGEHFDEKCGSVNYDHNQCTLDKTDSNEPMVVDNTDYSSPLEFPVCLDYYEEDEDEDEDDNIQTGANYHCSNPFEDTAESCAVNTRNFTYDSTDSSTRDSYTTNSSRQEKNERKRKRGLALEDIRLRRKAKISEKETEKKMSNDREEWEANDCLGDDCDKEREEDNLETPRKLKFKDYSAVESSGINSDSKGFVDISNTSYEQLHSCYYQTPQDTSDSSYSNGSGHEVGSKLETPRKLKIKDYSLVKVSENKGDKKGFVDIVNQSSENFHLCKQQAQRDLSDISDGDSVEQEEGSKLETRRKLKIKGCSLLEALGNESDLSNDFVDVASQSYEKFHRCKHQSQHDLIDSEDWGGDKQEGGGELETPRKLKIKDVSNAKALGYESDFSSGFIDKSNRNSERFHESDEEKRISTKKRDPNDEIPNSLHLEAQDAELCMDDGKAFEDTFSVERDDSIQAANVYLAAIDGQKQTPMKSVMDSVNCMENSLTSDDPFSVSPELNPRAITCLGAASRWQQQDSIRLLCSESFLENFGDVIAEVVRGDSIVCNNDEPSEVRTRPIQFIDTDLVDACSVDIEMPSRGAMVVSTLSKIRGSGGLMEVFLPRIVELVATNRYDRLAIFVCIDVKLDYAATRDLVRLQTAFLTHGIPKTQTNVQWASKKSLPSCIAQTAYQSIESRKGLPSCAQSNMDYWLSDSRTCQRLKFLLSIIPTLSVSGALHWLDLCVGDPVLNRCPSRVAAQDCTEIGDKSAKWFQRCFRHVETESKLLESYLLRSTANTELELWSSMNPSVPKQLVDVVRARLDQI